MIETAKAIEFFFKHWRLILSGIGAAVLAIYIGIINARAENLATRLSETQAELSTTKDNLKALTELSNAVSEAVLKNQALERENHVKQTNARDQVIRAPQADDAPVAPVLRRAFDSLR